MANNRNIYRSVLLTGIESTPGVNMNPSINANAVLITEPITSPGGDFAVKTPRDNVITGITRGIGPLTPVGLMGTWAIKAQARGTRNGLAYAGGNLPDLDPIYQAAGLSSTLTGSASVAYSPFSGPTFKTITAEYFTDGILRTLVGAVVESLTFDFKAGGPLDVDATLLGIYSESDTAFPNPAFFGSTVPPALVNIALNFDGFTSGIIRSMKWTVRNTTTGPRMSVNAPNALVVPEKRQDKSTATIVMEMQNLGDINLTQLAANATPFPVSWALNGATNNQFAFSAPAAVIIGAPKISNEKGTELATIELDLVPATPGSDTPPPWTLTFT